MKHILAVISLLLLTGIVGCNNDGPLDADLVDLLAGSWSGVIDYSESGGAAVPMTLTLTEDGNYKLKAQMATAEAVYEDDFVAEVNDNIVMNFAVAGETWELVLEGQLAGTSFEGNIIQREAGEDDILLGTWTAVPS